MRYDLEGGRMVERPHCGEFVKYDAAFDDQGTSNIIKEMAELIERMKGELEDANREVRTFDSEVRYIRSRLNSHNRVQR
jgi:hypothetical protein